MYSGLTKGRGRQEEGREGRAEEGREGRAEEGGQEVSRAGGAERGGTNRTTDVYACSLRENYADAKANRDIEGKDRRIMHTKSQMTASVLSHTVSRHCRCQQETSH
jgi:hypothetical protein